VLTLFVTDQSLLWLAAELQVIARQVETKSQVTAGLIVNKGGMWVRGIRLTDVFYASCQSL